MSTHPIDDIDRSHPEYMLGAARQVVGSILDGGHGQVPESVRERLTTLARVLDVKPAEPQQIGYPVMAGCPDRAEEHLHVRKPRSVLSLDGWPWECETDSVSWQGLRHPRDLTPDEVTAHNLWTGLR